MLHFASFISGSGSTMERLIIECQHGSLQNIAKPVLIVASSNQAGGIGKAIRLGISEKDIVILNKETIKDNVKLSEIVLRACHEHGVEAIFLNGWLKQIPKAVIDEFAGNIYNQHPAPKEFGGKYMYGLVPHAAILNFRKLISFFLSVIGLIAHSKACLISGSFSG